LENGNIITITQLEFGIIYTETPLEFRILVLGRILQVCKRLYFDSQRPESGIEKHENIDFRRWVEYAESSPIVRLTGAKQQWAEGIRTGSDGLMGEGKSKCKDGQYIWPGQTH